MTINLDYASEKLTSAIRALATSSASLQDRLSFVCKRDFHTLDRGGILPTKEFKERFSDIVTRLTANPIPGSNAGSLQDTLSQMDNREAEAIAEAIFDLYREIESHRMEGSHL